ncbi:glycosyltransferase family 2 protein [Maridesulfovibrio bastinii]|uniref:glycosyltransferase family 2 protein n=1 Tax=Maridesulfovibrio bastinii TaxID=47157 RepID=UPI0009FBEEEF|nr:glycosyltransferase family 2 protein [Maridesulfovibrio bastinii]
MFNDSKNSNISGIISTPPEARENLSLISIVIPLYNEREGLDALFKAISSIQNEISIPMEVVCIDDGSFDNTYEALCLRPEPYIRAFKFSRNFGKEAALSAGLDMCRGDVVIPIDADLQEPPELILEMIEEWKKGYDVVFAVRKSRKHDSYAKQLTAGLFYKLFNFISESKIPENSGDFRLMDKAVVDAIKKMPERNRFMKGLLTWPGFSSTRIYFDRPERFVGESKWSPIKLLGLAANGLISFSTIPLRVALICGILTSSMAFIFAVYVVVRHLLYGDPVQGYASLMTAIAFFAGMQLLALGALGEYVGRVYIETKMRPLYIISKVHEKSEEKNDAL